MDEILAAFAEGMAEYVYEAYTQHMRRKNPDYELRRGKRTLVRIIGGLLGLVVIGIIGGIVVLFVNFF